MEEIGVKGKLLLWTVMIGLGLTCRSQSWDEWLRGCAGVNLQQSADRIVGMLAAIEQEHCIVLQSGALDLSYESNDVSTDSGLTVFAQKVAKDINLSFDAVTAQYSKECETVRLDGDLHTDVLKIQVGAEYRTKPGVVKGLLCRVLSGLKINWNMVGSTIPESWKGSSRKWEWELREINAICLGLGGVLLESAEVASTIDGNSRKRSCTRHMSLEPADLAWTIAAVKLLRRQELTLSCKSDLAKVAWIVGKSSAAVNTERIRDQMKTFAKSLDAGRQLVLPGTDKAWQCADMDPNLFQGLVERSKRGKIEGTGLDNFPIRPIDIPKFKPIDIPKIDLPEIPAVVRCNGLPTGRSKAFTIASLPSFSAFPEYVQPTPEEAREWWLKRNVTMPQTPVPDKDAALAAKKRVAKVIAQIKAEVPVVETRVGRIIEMAQKATDAADRFFMFQEAVAIMMSTKAWERFHWLFSDMVVKEGAEFALAVVRPYRVRIGVMSKRSGDDLAGLMTEAENAINFLTKNAATLSSVGADQQLLARAAKCYLTLGAVTNAHAAIACSDVKLDRLMRLTEGEKFRTRPFFWWMTPPPEYEVAEFWRSIAKVYATCKPYCDKMCETWYAKALETVRCPSRGVIKPLPTWMANAQRWVNGPQRSVSKQWWNKVHYIDWKELRLFADQGTYYKDCVCQGEASLNNKLGCRPSSYWLDKCEPFCWRQNGMRTLVVPVETMPLLDSDYDLERGVFPSRENLDKAFSRAPKATANNLRTWVLRYYGLHDGRLALLDVSKDELKHEGYSVAMVKFVQVDGKTVSALIKAREGGEVYFLEVQAETGGSVDEELIKRYVKDIQLCRKWI